MVLLNNKVEYVKCADTNARIEEAFNIVSQNQCDISIPEVYEAYSYLYACMYYQIADIKNHTRTTIDMDNNESDLIGDGFQYAFMELTKMLRNNEFRSWVGLRKWLTKTTKTYVYRWNVKRTSETGVGFYDKVNVVVPLSNVKLPTSIEEKQDESDVERLVAAMDSDSYRADDTPETYQNKLFVNDTINAVLASPVLNKTEKEILKLRFYEIENNSDGDKSLTFSQIGTRLGINENTVKTTYYSALKKCRGICEQMGIDASLALGV